MRDENGTSWLTVDEYMRSPRRGATWFNFGMAQGFPSVITFLALACRERIAGAESLLFESATWLSRQRVADQPGRCFPLGIDSGEEISPERSLGWCNGDLPTAIALIQAGICLGESAWIKMAIEVATLAASLPVDDLPECGLCHGAAGVALMFAFLNNVAPTPVFAAAAQSWFRQVIRRADAGQRYEGFSYLLDPPRNAPPDAYPVWQSSGQFLRGAGGIALALLAASTAVPPEWSAALMMHPWKR